ncbi:30S ribosome-binding factor RbfA [Marinigracilibium pacificum]|uniref:Ribosome-binding factor A n=1 Tax=Marinigracilibium pacificum TaxID=2729599 RepID=A0A848IR61_9BACT|nr:30S ribosome-binding factor RbfA [Marinigracilibium pacificum]NMM46953.1 30S ribosome-binding factor RbfA [Marinigracilibium pacificum]
MSVSQRQLKFSRLIQEELSQIFQREGKNVIGNAFVTITRVDISPDLKVSKAYLSLLAHPDKDGFMDTINDRKSEIRKFLGNRIGKQVRAIPELIFYLDEGAEYAGKIDNLLKNLDIPPEEEQDEDED